MSFDYIIVGLGPTGITLGLNLLNTNKKVLFIEASNNIGGCWKIDNSDGYFIEHSPKVLSERGSREFNKLLNYLDINPRYKSVYADNNLYTNHLKDLKYFTWKDILHLSIYFVLYLIWLNDKKISLQNWCKSKKISKKAQDYLNIRAIAISNTFDKLTADAFVKFFIKRYEYMFDLKGLESPREWIDASYRKLSDHPHSTILMDTRVKKMMITNNTVTGVLTQENEVYYSKYIITCVPLRSLYTIMHNSSYPNWFPTLDYFKEYVKQSSYTGIGFQLHYTEKRKLPQKWCWSCQGDWKVIILDKSKVLKSYSKDEEIKQVLSCVVVDLDTKSRFINKTANECESVTEIVYEAFRQINGLSNNLLIGPKNITTSNNLFYSNDFGWESFDSSYSPSSHGRLPYRGELKNLYSVGPHNSDEVVVIETAIQSAKRFSKDILKIKNVF